MKIPDLFVNSNLINSEKFDYEWNKKVTDYIFIDSENENEKLEQAFDLLNHKAKIGLSAAISEWIYWQMCQKKNDKLAYYAIESIWASLIDKRYIVNGDFFFREDDDTILQDKIEGPLWRVSFLLSVLVRDYIRGRYSICINLIPLTILARHITSNKEDFDEWIANCLSRLARDFPARYVRNKVKNNDIKEYKKGFYDSSTEPAIPREFFFDESFIYDEKTSSKLINNFLGNISYQENIYLNSPEEMLNNGFDGVPYKYEIE
ncbi:hypothetical protein I2492_04010 [Budviciaceae bacterium CWB-B4]|uniref:Uncharacterized protein n=1 Tax=Limnobaculum xujianqingii TaxID=2738837 RepID=A0A9D7FRK4_9GAMM|nr:hypothetical protein [Limnobaculum xujianqingii]MBK5072180.1 hypothetical protein [Limnobaculum xujianqingii]MBK5175489.1 hypothetical protein [Limnobaculum xujianqingii]